MYSSVQFPPTLVVVPPTDPPQGDNMAPARKSPSHIPEVRISAGGALSIRGLIERISWNLPGAAEENHDKPESV
jgi:hypothetical protein